MLQKIFAQVVDLLEKLGFLVKKEKCSPIPCQRLIFLGAALDSTTMTLSLPQPKLTSIVDTCHNLLAQGSGLVRSLSTLIGQMSHASQTGTLVAPLHYRGLQRLYLQAVSQHGQARKVIVPLTSQAHKDLEWWVSESSCRLNGCPTQLPPIDLTVWSDASKTDWGAADQGIATGCHWSVEEAQWHINVIELRALKVRLQSQEAQHPPLKHIHLRIDNTTEVAYINKRGGTRSPALTAQALEFWAVALTAGVSLTAQHIPGIQNVVADTASRQIETRTEWTLDRKIFQSICQRFYTPDVDLFACHLNHQLITQVCLEVPRSGGSGCGCIPPGLEQMDLSNPSSRSTEEDQRGSSNCRPPNCPELERTAMISRSHSDAGGSPTAATPAPISVVSPISANSIPSPVEVPSSDSLATIRDHYQATGFSKEVVDILVASWGKATQKRYSGPWRAWVRWCSQRGSCPISVSVAEVLAFLAFLVIHGNLEYKTIALYRSAISQAHDPVGCTQLGSLPVVIRFMKGVFKIKPPKPRYRSTWNVKTALSFLDSLEPLEELTLKQLCYKTVLLLALTSAARAHDLPALDLTYFLRKEGSWEFSLRLFQL